MPAGLKRYYGFGDLHFITCSCYQRRALLGSPRTRETFLRIFEQVRRKYRFEVYGYVVMPEHFHTLIGEPEIGNPSTAMQVVKQNVALELLSPNGGGKQERHFWLPRFYDFNVFTYPKIVEKLRYMHRNPVKRGLVPSPEMWPWSSYRAYAFEEVGLVKVRCLTQNPTIRSKEKSI